MCALYVLMPFNRSFDSFCRQFLDELRTNDVLAETFSLQQLEVFKRRPRIIEVFDVWRPAPVLEICKVRDKSGIVQELLRRKMVEVERIREALYELNNTTVSKAALSYIGGKGPR